jgi:uncharacterized membrane protein YgcG
MPGGLGTPGPAIAGIGQEADAMKRLLAFAIAALAVLCLLPAARAGASTLSDCLADHHVCVTGSGRGLISGSQQAALERQIGRDDIYLVVAPSGSAGYNSAMNQIIGDLSGHEQFTVGFADSRLLHFGADSRGMLPSGAAGEIATRAVQAHQGDQDVFAALTQFVGDVQREAGSGPVGAAAGGPSHVLRNLAITLGVILALGLLGFFLIARPVRDRRRRELREAKSAAQDDLIALSSALTDRRADVSVQSSPEAAREQAAALSAYARGTAAMDAARRVSDMGAVSQAIAEGQYRLECADAAAAGRPRPERRPSCFFDPRHGMSVTDAPWRPAAGGPGRDVPVCIACAHKLEQGIEPDMRQVEVNGAPVSYVNAGFAPAYWGGFGFGPGLFTGFLLGNALAPPIFGSYYSGGGDYGSGQDGGDFGGGDFGGGDFGGGDFGGGDFGGGDFGGGDF